MKISTEKEISRKILNTIKFEAHGKSDIRIMEVCGTHTMEIGRHGIRKIIPDNINLISGPGCPVCVTPVSEIDRAIEIAKLPDVVIATFGDMVNVPGTRSTLAHEKALGSDIHVIYSPDEAVAIAENNPERKVVLLGIGFETTAPSMALTVLESEKKGLINFFLLPALKTVIPPMEAVLTNDNRLDAFLAPGHVSAIIGAKPYEYIASEYRKPCVITGFGFMDILQGILMAVRQISRNENKVEIQYSKVVKYEGNRKAVEIMNKVFRKADVNWRGIGNIPGSGLILNENFIKFDAVKHFNIDISFSKEPHGCKCGEVLKGIIKPDQCGLFGRKCTPNSPVGPCMVSGEGSCAAYYKYEGAIC